MKRTAQPPARALVLLAVMLVLVAACLIGGSIAARSAADVDGARFRLHAQQARAAAWSGVLAVMVQLESQRSALLAGERPELTASFDLARSTDSVAVTARVLPMSGDGPLVAPQASLVSVNGSPVEMLRAIGVFDDAAAATIEARARDHEFSSVEEALALVGIDAAGTAESGEPSAAGGRPLSSADPSNHAGLDVLTAYSFDPEVLAGVDDHDSAGRERRAWASVLEAGADEPGLAREYGSEAAPAVLQLVGAKAGASTRAQLVSALRRAGLAPRYWGRVLDRVRAGDEEFAQGRVDLAGAPANVLACVPGIGPEHARALVQARERLSADVTRSLSWPVAEGILSPDEFERAVDHLTTRSAQFRVRVEGAVSARGDDTRPGRTLSRVIYDAVIDVGSTPARVAYLRDATMLETAALLRARQAPAETKPDSPDQAPQVDPDQIPLDAAPARADNTPVLPVHDLQPGSSGDPPPAPPHGRVGRWSPGPRTRGGG